MCECAQSSSLDLDLDWDNNSRRRRRFRFRLRNTIWVQTKAGSNNIISSSWAWSVCVHVIAIARASERVTSHACQIQLEKLACLVSRINIAATTQLAGKSRTKFNSIYQTQTATARISMEQNWLPNWNNNNNNNLRLNRIWLNERIV